MPGRLELPADLRAFTAARQGLVRASDCRRLGISDSRVGRLLDRGLLVKLAKGVYADARVVADADPWALFDIRSRAFILSSAPGTHAAGWSAAVLHRLPTNGAPPDRPTGVRVGARTGGSDETRNGRTRFVDLPVRMLTRVGGIPTVRPAFAAVDLARHADRLTGLMLTDAVAASAGSADPLRDALRCVAGWPHATRASWAVDHCDPDTESPLESAGRLAFLDAGLPPSLTNVWVGEYVPRFRLDHFWPERRVAAEADGLAKYLLADPGQALRDEKDREWWLQSAGIRVLRYGYKQAVGHPRELAARCRRLLDAPPLPSDVRIRTWPRGVGLGLRHLER